MLWKSMFEMRSFISVAVNTLINNTLRFSCFTEPFDCCSSSLPQTQSTVILIKLCAALLTFSPMVIWGYSHCESCCKPPHEPVRTLISSFRGFRALVSLYQLHLSKHWAWVWLWNFLTYWWIGPRVGNSSESQALRRIIFDIYLI